MIQDARHFLISSDYPMDFIVWEGNGQVSSYNYHQTTDTVKHNLPYTPLVFGQFSLDGGNTWFPAQVNDYYTNKIDFWVESDATNVYVHCTALENNAKTATYRLWAFAPANSAGRATTPSQSNLFYLDSDSNYSKLVKAGVWDIQSGDRKTIYNHNLGYIPEVMVWLETSDGKIRDGQSVFSGKTEYWPIQYMQIDENNLYAEFSSNTQGMVTFSKVHYRIYGDQNG